MQLKWYTFSELTNEQLYAVLTLRCDIFIVEQGCPYLDPDNKDFFALHLLGTEGTTLVAYLRVFAPINKDRNVVFGRVLTAKAVRHKGYGKKLMQELLNY